MYDLWYRKSILDMKCTVYGNTQYAHDILEVLSDIFKRIYVCAEIKKKMSIL